MLKYKLLFMLSTLPASFAVFAVSAAISPAAIACQR